MHDARYFSLNCKVESIAQKDKYEHYKRLQTLFCERLCKLVHKIVNVSTVQVERYLIPGMLHSASKKIAPIMRSISVAARVEGISFSACSTQAAKKIALII
jgi:hypothetical protein